MWWWPRTRVPFSTEHTQYAQEVVERDTTMHHANTRMKAVGRLFSYTSALSIVHNVSLIGFMFFLNRKFFTFRPIA